jgi:hypothetical protein
MGCHPSEWHYPACHSMSVWNTLHQNVTCHILPVVFFSRGAGVAQSVQCLTMDWTTGRSGFNPRQGQRIFSSNLCVKTGSEAHPASCTMGIRGPFPETKRSWGVTLTTHPHPMQRSRMSRSYTSSPPPPTATMACSGTALLFTYFSVDQTDP